MKVILVLLFLFALSSTTEADNLNKAYEVHGRLSLWNGNPSCRIWIVGTKRILGLAEPNESEIPAMPDKLFKMMAWDTDIFGDFVVEPLTRYKPGTMQTVRILSAKNLVIEQEGKPSRKIKKL